MPALPAAPPTPSATRLLRLFRALRWASRARLESAFGADYEPILREVEGQLHGLAPRVPRTGAPDGDRLLDLSAVLLALHLALAPRGWTAAQTGALLYDCTVTMLSDMPGWAKRALRALFFLPAYNRRLLKRIVGEAPPHGFEGEYLAGGPGSFSFGVNYTRCALLCYLTAEGHPELAPQLCALDRAQSDAWGLGLARTGTLATGADRCDFRWTRPG